MKLIPLTLGIFLSTSLFAIDTANGKELFNEAKCMDCHNREDFVPNKVKNISEIHKKVEACAVAHDAGWFDDEMMDVVHYLNKEHYKFKDTKK